VTIITPTLNQAPFIEATIRSVVSQGYANLQYLVIDGGSTDGTVDILKRYDPWITSWVSEVDHGQSHAINKGLALADGEFVAWLNSDDMYLPGAMTEAIRVLSQDAGAAMVYGSAYGLDVNGAPVWQFPAARFDPVRTLFRNPIPQPAAFMRTEAIRAAGGLDESLHLMNDVELWLRLARQGALRSHSSRWAGVRLHREAKTLRCQDDLWAENLRVTAALLEDPAWSAERTAVRRAVGYAHWYASMTCYRLGDVAGARKHVAEATVFCPEGPRTARFAQRALLILALTGWYLDGTDSARAEVAVVEGYFELFGDALPAKRRALRMIRAALRALRALDLRRGRALRIGDALLCLMSSPAFLIGMGVRNWQALLARALASPLPARLSPLRPRSLPG